MASFGTGQMVGRGEQKAYLSHSVEQMEQKLCSSEDLKIQNEVEKLNKAKRSSSLELFPNLPPPSLTLPTRECRLFYFPQPIYSSSRSIEKEKVEDGPGKGPKHAGKDKGRGNPCPAVSSGGKWKTPLPHLLSVQGVLQQRPNGRPTK